MNRAESPLKLRAIIDKEKSMPEIKEKPKTDQAKSRHSDTGLPKQAGRLMKE